MTQNVAKQRNESVETRAGVSGRTSGGLAEQRAGGRRELLSGSVTVDNGCDCAVTAMSSDDINCRFHARPCETILYLERRYYNLVVNAKIG